METLFTPLPDIEELIAWIRGEGLAMPLTDEERERIREIETIRAQAQREAMQSLGGFLDGPVVGPCSGCGRPLRANWRFCAFCGAPSSATCPRCHAPLPREEGVQFCPQCGGRL